MIVPTGSFPFLQDHYSHTAELLQREPPKGGSFLLCQRHLYDGEGARAGRPSLHRRARRYADSRVRPGRAPSVRSDLPSRAFDMCPATGLSNEAVFRFFHDKGFTLEELKTCGARMGCNEFVFRRQA